MALYGFLSNDVLPDTASPPQVITFTIGSGPSHGTLYTWPAEGEPVTGAADADGSFRYVPDVGFSGEDTFTYTVYGDGTPIDTGTVTITVQAAPSGDWPPAPGDPDPSDFPRLGCWQLSFGGTGGGELDNMADRSGTTPAAWFGKYHLCMLGGWPNWSNSGTGGTGWSYANHEAIVDAIHAEDTDILIGLHDNIQEHPLSPKVQDGSITNDYELRLKLSDEDWNILQPFTRSVTNINVGSSTMVITWSGTLDINGHPDYPGGDWANDLNYNCIRLSGCTPSSLDGSYPVLDVNNDGAATQATVYLWDTHKPYSSWSSGGTVTPLIAFTAFGYNQGRAGAADSDNSNLTPDGSGDYWHQAMPKIRVTQTIMNGGVEWDCIGSDRIESTAALSSLQDFNRDGVADVRDATLPQYAIWRENQALAVENMLTQSVAAGNTRGKYIFLHTGRYQHSGLTVWDLAGCGEDSEYQFRSHWNQCQFCFGDGSLLEGTGNWDLQRWEFGIKFVVKCRYYCAEPRMTFWDATHFLSSFDNSEAGFSSNAEALRFSFASCLLTDCYFTPGGADGNQDPRFWSELDNAGASSKWLGAAVDGAISDWPAIEAAGGAYSTDNLVAGGANRLANGVYYRRFENGIALVNPPDNGNQTVTLSQIDSATYQRIDASGAPSDGREPDDGYNDGTVETSFTLNEGRGVILRRIP